MSSSRFDHVVTVLVEVQGGPDKWARAEEQFDRLDWTYRELTPRERRIARRAFDADAARSAFRWVDVRVAGSLWRADRRASWQLADLAKDAQLTLYDHRLTRPETDRLIQPEWQVYSTRRRDWSTPPPHVPARSRPLWWLRGALYEAAVRTGRFDLDERMHGSRESVLQFARRITSDAPRTDIDVRPLDGRGRTGAVQHREDALNRGLALLLGPLLVMALLLVVARDAGSFAKLVLWLLAIGCVCVAWWTALALPLARTWQRSLGPVVLITVLAVVYALGVPGLSTGLAQREAVLLAVTAYLVVGLALVVRHWRWQLLLVGVLPLVMTAAVGALPLTSRVLHDGYADELSLTSAETSVSGLWQLVAAIKLLWPALGAVLFVAAGWGLLRYFHFVRQNSYFARACVVLLFVLAVVTAGAWTLDSPLAAAARVRQAAAERTAPPPYFGVSPEWMCVIPTVSVDELNEQGGTLSPARPYLSFGVVEGRAVLWNAGAEKPLRIPTDQVRLVPPASAESRCT